MFALYLVLSVLGLYLALGVRRVREGEAVTVHRFGRYRRTLQPGMHFVLPGLDRLAHRIPLSGRSLSLDLRARGDQAGLLHSRLYYQVLDAAKADEDSDVLDARVMALAQRRAAGIEAESAQDLMSRLRDALNTELADQGLRVVRIRQSAQTGRIDRINQPAAA